MKVQVEKAVSPLEFMATPSRFVMSEFNRILEILTTSKNVDDGMKKLAEIELQFFVYGSGSSHIWVMQIGVGIPKERVLLAVENEN